MELTQTAMSIPDMDGKTHIGSYSNGDVYSGYGWEKRTSVAIVMVVFTPATVGGKRKLEFMTA